MDDASGYRRWTLLIYAKYIIDQLPEEPLTDNDVILWLGQFWITQGMHPKAKTQNERHKSDGNRMCEHSE